MKKVLVLTYAIGVVTVTGLALVTGVDVIGRYVFSRPIFGANDMIEILMGMLFACGIAVTSALDDHISVDSVYDKLSSTGKLVLRIFASLVVVFIFIILVWQGFQGGIIGLKSGKASNTLEIPLFPFKFFLALGFLAALIFSVRQLISLLHRKKATDDSTR